MNTVLVLILVIIALLIIIIAIAKVCRKLQEDKTNLELELAKQKKISQELLHYAEEIAKINGDENKVAQQIKEAENEEELMAIIAGLVHTNNDRVRK